MLYSKPVPLFLVSNRQRCIDGSGRNCISNIHRLKLENLVVSSTVAGIRRAEEFIRKR